MRVLLVKMSSLGDVVHSLPAVSDLAAQGARIDWVVEEAFAPIAAAHPQVDNVLVIAWRRWRRHLPRFWQARAATARRELGEFRALLRARQYDLVIDAQGLYKSALVSRAARAPRRAGLDRHSAREPGAARFYTEQVPVSKSQHAVDRVRQLCAQAVGYDLPGQPRSGLESGIANGLKVGPQNSGAVPVCLLLHGTTWASKHYPEPMWVELSQRAQAAGYEPVLTWGDANEEARARRIAVAGDATLWPRMDLTELMTRLRSAALVVGVDSGIAHLSAALGVPTLGLYGATDAELTGVRGARSHNLAADFVCAPCVRRECTYRGAPVSYNGAAVEPPCFAQLPPERVWQAAQALVAG